MGMPREDENIFANLKFSAIRDGNYFVYYDGNYPNMSKEKLTELEIGIMDLLKKLGLASIGKDSQ